MIYYIIHKGRASEKTVAPLYSKPDFFNEVLHVNPAQALPVLLMQVIVIIVFVRLICGVNI